MWSLLICFFNALSEPNVFPQISHWFLTGLQVILKFLDEAGEKVKSLHDGSVWWSAWGSDKPNLEWWVGEGLLVALHRAREWVDEGATDVSIVDITESCSLKDSNSFSLRFSESSYCFEIIFTTASVASFTITTLIVFTVSNTLFSSNIAISFVNFYNLNFQMLNSFFFLFKFFFRLVRFFFCLSVLHSTLFMFIAREIRDSVGIWAKATKFTTMVLGVNSADLWVSFFAICY